MKELMRIMWVLLIQYIASSLAGWETSVTLLTLALVIIWQGIFAGVNNSIRKQKNTYGKRDVSLVMYMVLSVPALCFPVSALFIFFGLSVYRVCVIGGVTVGDEPLKKQFIAKGAASTPSFIENEGFEEINPASGLEMCGATDIAGNLYGMSNYP
ncbi:hypothetical protein ACSN7O_004467 [Enterobacter chuandaensis]